MPWWGGPGDSPGRLVSPWRSGVSDQVRGARFHGAHFHGAQFHGARFHGYGCRGDRWQAPRRHGVWVRMSLTIFCRVRF
ncbi:MAG: pentapeptide repeat-containing protein [Actinopolymorphaceae bacterium]